MSAAGRARRMALWQPLRRRNFRYVWLGETVSLLGDQFHFVALAWLTLQLTGSGLALGAVLTAAAVPRAVLMLVGGAVTDRFSPRTVILASYAGRGVAVAVVAALVLTGAVQIWHLVVLGLLFGVSDAFFFPAIGTIVPRLVPPEELEPANALHQGILSLAGFVGPALAGVLVATAGTGAAFVIDAASFAIATLALLLVDRDATSLSPAVASAPHAPAGSGMLRTIRAGLAYAWRDPGMRSLILLSAAFNLAFSGPVQVGLPWLANVRFGDPVALGTMFSGWGLGALVGSVLAGSLRLGSRQGARTMAIGAFLGLGIASLAFVPHYLVAAALIAIMGIAGGFLNVGLTSWIQRRSSPEMLGRVMSILMLAGVGLTPISLAVSGLIADVAIVALFVGGGLIVLVTVLVGVASGAVHDLDREAPEHAAGDPARERPDAGAAEPAR